MVHRVLPCFVFATFAFATAAFSQTSPVPSNAVLNEVDILSHEGQIVSLVELTGRPDLQTERYRQLIPIYPGDRLSRAGILKAIDALRNMRFDNVQVDLKPEFDGVRVAFILQPAFYVGLYQFPGAERFPYGLLIQISRFSAQEPYSPADIKNGQEALLGYFRQNGYFRSSVDAEVRADKTNALANVDFKTTLGPRAKFGNVLIEGVSPEEARRIQEFLRSFRARVRRAAVRPGRTYSPKALQNATRYMESRLADDKHPIVHVKVTSANYNPQTNRADVTFSVDRGAAVQARVEGAKLSSRAERKLLPVYPESGLSPESIQDGRRNLLRYFRDRGYFQAKVDATVEEDGEKTLVYEISKGPRKRIEKIEFRGNTHFTAEELEQHLEAREAHILSRGRYDENSVRLLTAFYQSQGFNEVNITPEFVPAGGRDLILRFEVNEGSQDIVEDLHIEGNAVPVAKLAPGGLRLGPGRPFSQSAMAEDKSRLVASYLDRGYLAASLQQTSEALPSDPHRFHVLYEITEGPQVHARKVVTLGRNRTDQTLIDRDTAGIRPGAPLTESKLFTTESRLFSRGVFDWSQVNLRRRITSQDQEDVIVKVHEAKRNNVLYGFGFQMTSRGGNVPSGRVAVPGLPTLQVPSTFVTNEETFVGPTANFQYTRNNVRGRAETASFGASYGPLDRTVQFDFINPQFRWTNWRAVLEAAADYNKQNPIFTSRQVLGTFQLEHPLDEKKQQSLILRYSLSRLNLTDLAIPELVPEKDRNTRLSTLSAVYIRDARESAVDPHKGTYVSFEANENPRIFGSNTTFTRLQGQVAWYRELKPAWIWANSIRGGLLLPAKGVDIPISQRFFTGGGSTLRGFPLNGAGPQTAVPACSNPSDPSTCALIDVPIGGVQLLIINSEFRVPAPFKKGLSLVGFYDGGNVFDPALSNHSFNLRYTNTAGLGFRYATPIGPVRVDIGRNLNPVPGINPTQLFITLGQAF